MTGQESEPLASAPVGPGSPSGGVDPDLDAALSELVATRQMAASQRVRFEAKLDDAEQRAEQGDRARRELARLRRSRTYRIARGITRFRKKLVGTRRASPSPETATPLDWRASSTTFRSMLLDALGNDVRGLGRPLDVALVVGTDPRSDDLPRSVAVPLLAGMRDLGYNTRLVSNGEEFALGGTLVADVAIVAQLGCAQACPVARPDHDRRRPGQRGRVAEMIRRSTTMISSSSRIRSSSRRSPGGRPARSR